MNEMNWWVQKDHGKYFFVVGTFQTRVRMSICNIDHMNDDQLIKVINDRPPTDKNEFKKLLECINLNDNIKFILNLKYSET